jgi:hypothetical protein
MVRPPSTTKVAPVAKADSSEARKTATQPYGALTVIQDILTHPT